MRLGLWVVDDRATVAAEARTMLAPLGHAVSTQYTLIRPTTQVARAPAASAVIQWVRGTNEPFHCSRSWLWSASDAWVRA
ncbi:hypothetical protein IBA8403_29400 [Pseudomonas syringae]